VSKGWPLVPMDDIFAIARGGSPRPIDSFITDDPDGVNWVMISDATESGKYINSTKKRIREEGVKRSRVVQPGDFLLTNSMSFGRPYIMNTSGCIHDGWLVLSPRHQNVSPDFFYHLLGSDFVYAEFVRRAAGATVKNLNIDLVKGVQVPLPPMEEQRRIAEVLDRTEALRAKRRVALAQFDSLTQSIFLDLFGDPLTSVSKWPRTTLGDVLEHLAYGPRFYNESYSEDGVRIVRITDLDETGRLDFDGMPRLAVDTGDREKYGLREGDLLFARSGSVGKSGVFPAQAPPCIAGAYFIVMRFKGHITSLFVRSVLATDSVQRFIQSRSRQAIQPNFSGPALRALPLPVPPLTLQHEFADRVAAMEKLEAAHRASLAGLATLFDVLQHRAFRGEL
jgi:type I restriction enzyme S subunit